MSTQKSVYGYLNTALHSVDFKKVWTETSVHSDPLSYFDSNSETILYKAWWHAYFNDRP